MATKKRKASSDVPVFADPEDSDHGDDEMPIKSSSSSSDVPAEKEKLPKKARTGAARSRAKKRREKAEAEAVGYLAVGEALKTWKPSKSTFNTYIWIIVRGRILDSNRKEWNRGGVTSSHAPFFSDIDKLTEQDFGLLIDSGEHSYECLELYRKISKLNPNEKNVLVLRYFDGLTHKMIGNMLGFSRRYVISLEQAGIQSLKKKYSYN